MKSLFLVSLFCFALHSSAADVIVAPTIAVDTTINPPTVTITLTIDGTKAVTAMTTAIAKATADNAAALAKDPNAPQPDPLLAGRSAFSLALVPDLYKLVEDTQNGASKSDADIAATVTALKAKADADAAALQALRPVITVK